MFERYPAVSRGSWPSGPASGTWRGEALALGLVRLCTRGRIRNESRSPGTNSFGLFPVRTDVRALGFGPDRRKLGVRGLQAGISEPGDGERRCWGIAIGLALRRILGAFRRALH